MLFDHCRDAIRLVFECGIGSNDESIPSNMTANGRPGASLRVWRDYFPLAQIVGADIDGKILFQEERIRTYQVDQRDPASISEMWNRAGVSNLDLIVDDGLHEYQAGICLFQNSWGKLREGGLYVIEDIPPRDMRRYHAYFAPLGLNVSYVLLHRGTEPVGGNTMLLIRKARA
jgi:hypothetical protein